MNAPTKAYLEEVIRTFETRFRGRTALSRRYAGSEPKGRRQLWELRLYDGAKELLAAHALRCARAKGFKQQPDCPGQTYVPGTEPTPAVNPESTTPCPSTTETSASQPA